MTNPTKHFFPSPRTLTRAKLAPITTLARAHIDPYAPMDPNHFGSVLDQPGSIHTVQQVHAQILFHNVSSFLSLTIKLVRAYAILGHDKEAGKVFDGVSERNVVLCNSMIRGYVKNQHYREALLLYRDMVGFGVYPDKYTFPCALKACSGVNGLELGLQIHGVSVKLGCDYNLFVGNALMAMYAKCSDMDQATKVFESMKHRDVVSWNTVVAGYAQNGFFGEALEACKEMEIHGENPDAGTLASLQPALLQTEPKAIEIAREIFDKIIHRNLVSYNAMISVYSSNDMAKEAIEILSWMRIEGVKPDVVTFASVLPACGHLSALAQGKLLHSSIIVNGFRENMFLENALVDMYSKCGNLKAARDVFDRMSCRDVVTWTAMISAYGIHGKGREALALFYDMCHLSLKPDSIALVSILSACSHGGLVDEGLSLFESMNKDYQVVPRVEHYACVVDLLGRAGRLEMAYNFIKQMPLEPNNRIWGALLSACRVYKNTTIGTIAADNLFKLAPSQSGYYVLLSNIYASSGRWGDVALVRNLMRSQGIKKQPGSSTVELGNDVHSFLVGDRYHPQSDVIYAKLEALAGEMKEAGYAVDTDSALHDLEDEDKEGHLAVHSEKLAIAFLLINTGPGTIIRVTKNLRICEDCHVASKFISKITGREIVLRDTNRFHCFKDGSCSCRDYW
ncbi:hypothetical protein AMTRI_Chr08g202130 [Amborella trichopoda]